MEKTKFLTIVIIFLLVLNLGTLVFLFLGKAPGHGPHPRFGPEGPASFIIEELKFDDQQQTAFNDLKKEHQGQMRSMEDSMRLQREQWPDIIISGNSAKADSVSGIIGHHQKQIELFTYQHFVKVYNLCNADQKKKFKNIINDILKMMGPKIGSPPPR